MLRLFHTQETALIRMPDKRLRPYMEERPHNTVYEDRDPEITATADTSVGNHIAAVCAAPASKSCLFCCVLQERYDVLEI